MKRSHSCALITGAAGGIGSSVARRLAASGTNLLLTDLSAPPLDALATELRRTGIEITTIVADITATAGRNAVVRKAQEQEVDVLINIAGVNPFGLFEKQTPAEIERALLINASAPMLLCQALIPVLKERAEAHIVNLGSTFGSIGFPGFCIYSASKFALRGFTEALRRELSNTSVRVHYVAPRATRTALSTERVRAMNRELKIGMDSPETVARVIERTLRRGRRATYLGLPERFFVLINSLAPGVVDRSLRRQLPVIQRYAAAARHPSDDTSRTPSTLQPLGAK